MTTGTDMNSEQWEDDDLRSYCYAIAHKRVCGGLGQGGALGLPASVGLFDCHAAAPPSSSLAMPIFGRAIDIPHSHPTAVDFWSVCFRSLGSNPGLL